MKIQHTLLLSLLSLCTAAIPAGAQISTTPAPSESPAPRRDDSETRDLPPAPPWMKALDADGDRVISAAEIQNAPTALRTLDTNKDGVLTPNELRPQRPDGEGGDRRGGRPPRRERRGDRDSQGGNGGAQKDESNGGGEERQGPRGRDNNHDRGGHRPPPPVIKALDADENREVSAAEIDKASESLSALDKNKDGQLTGDEIHPPRPPRPPEGGRRKGGDSSRP